MHDRNERRARTRRGFLASVASVGVVGLAGCGDIFSGGETTTDAGSGFDPEIAGPPVTPTDSGLLPAPSLGPADAPVTVMAFEDYGCGHCGTYSRKIFPQVHTEFIEPGDIRYEFHDFPIPVRRGSRPAANAARAVQNTVGEGAFWAYSKLLFENQNSLTLDTIADLASEVGADEQAVRTAADQLSYSETVQADRQRGIDMGVQGTPTIFVDGQKVSDYRWDNLSSVIESDLP